MGCGLADVAHVEVFWNGAGHHEPGCDVSKRRVPLTSGMAGDWSPSDDMDAASSTSVCPVCQAWRHKAVHGIKCFC